MYMLRCTMYIDTATHGRKQSQFSGIVIVTFLKCQPKSMTFVRNTSTIVTKKIL